MAIIIGGHETGLLDTSFGQLNRDDRTSESEVGQGEQLHVNVSNGNLVLTQQDAFMPSRGMDFQLIRTYNSRGVPSDAGQRDDERWSLTTGVSLNVTNEGGEQHFFVTYGDGSVLEYRLDAGTGLYVSTDGQGAYETLEDLGASGNDTVFYVVTRADQSRLSFDKDGRLLSWVDTNGVTTQFVYSQNRLVQVIDDDGHVLTYNYRSGNLVSITDEDEGVLVEYRYDKGQLVEVIDRFGHSTKYFYSSDGFLVRMVLPDRQTVDGQLETYASRELHFEYQSVNWSTGDSGRAKVLTRMVDAEGNVTTFDYQFDLVDGGGDDKFYNGGSTRVVDALGNARATSNEALYVQWRTANGYYADYNATAVQNDAALAMQLKAIRDAHSLTYSYRADGYITAVIDQEGYETRYNYDTDGNLLSVIDSNGWGAVHSDSSYYRALRQSVLGTNAPVPLSALTEADKSALTAAFTSRFTYDDRGNLLTSTDNLGNTTTYTYTDFNKLATMTSANGGVTTFSYDDWQNLIEQVDPSEAGVSGDVTRWQYDEFGNLVKRIVYLDPDDLDNPAKRQVTDYSYDLFGNNVETVDGEGNRTRNVFDHFGNLTQSIAFLDKAQDPDAPGALKQVTSYLYDKDNRLLSTTDPEGHTTFNSYDAVGNRISFTDANGKTITYIYDKNNRLVSTIDPAQSGPGQDRTTTRRYDVVGNELAVTDAEERTTTYRYNARRELVEVKTASVKGADGTTPTQYSSFFAYDGEGNAITLTDNRGNSTQFLYYADGLLRTETTALGHITEYTYDANRNVLTILAGAQLAPDKRQNLSFSYDSEDQILTVEDAEGNITEYSYDAPGTIASVTDGNNHRTDYVYDRNNRLIREIRPEVIDPKTNAPTRYTVEHKLDALGNEVETIDENGYSTFFEFDLDNRLVSTTDANGIVTTYAYDPNDNLTEVAIGAGRADVQVTSYVYDAFNQLIEETDGVGNALASSDEALYQTMREGLLYPKLAADLSDGQKNALRSLYTERYTYDRVGNLLSVEDHLERLTRYDYDNLNRLVLQTDALGQTRAYRYDGNGNLVGELDELDRERGYEYDAEDRQTLATDPLGSLTRYDYDAFGNLTKRSEALGTAIERVSEYVYDRNNLLVRETDPENHSVAYEYDAVGNRFKVTDARNNTTEYVYDALDRNIKIIDPLNFETRFEYDGVGNQIKIIDPRNHARSFTYDPGNRLFTAEDGEGRKVSFEYDAQGNVIVQTTGVGAAGSGSEGPETTQYTYDAEGNLRAIVDAKGERTEYGFDRVYNQTSMTDANLHSTGFSYDALNRVLAVTDAKGGQTRFSYDAVGNVLTETDPLDRVTSYAYNERDQLIVTRDALGVETHYDNNVFNVIAITRAANVPEMERTRSFVYDDDGQLVTETDELGFQIHYEYDANHNVTKVTDQRGNSTEYRYDANNQLRFIKDELDYEVEYRYDGSGNRVQIVDQRGNVTTNYYNGNNELELVVDALGYATSNSYDVNGNLKSVTRFATAVATPASPGAKPTPTPSPADQTIVYEYDELNRRIAETNAKGHTSYYSYDAVGNQIGFIDENGNATAYRYDALNRLDLVTDALGGTRGYVYDAVGNILSETDENDHTTTYTYSKRNQLLTRTNPLGKQQLFTYDYVDNRLTETDENNHTTAYQYDKLDRVIKRTDAAGNAAFFDYDKVGNQISFIDENGDESTTEYDALNRVKKEVDALGKTVEYFYDEYGNQTGLSDELGHTTGFSYDALNQLENTTGAEGGVRRQFYDAFGNIVRVIDETDRALDYGFDANNRLISVTDDLGGVYRYGYDDAGNKTSETDERNFTTTFVYDVLNRLQETIRPLGGKQVIGYDGVGNVTSLEDENQNVSRMEYDDNDRLVKLLSAEGYLTIIIYDDVGNELERREYNRVYTVAPGAPLPEPAAGDEPRITLSTYDELNRLETNKDSTGLTTEYEYDNVGNSKSMQQSAAPAGTPGSTAAITGNAGTETVIYDKKGRVTSRTDALGYVTFYVLDGKGRIESMTEAYGTPAARTTTYTYDNEDRIETETNPLGTKITYVYDKAGRLKTRTTSGNDVVDRVESYDYDEVGRLKTETSGEGRRTDYVYDAEGNVKQVIYGKGSSEEYSNFFEYDANDRLFAEIDGEGVRIEYSYDARGNKKTTTQAKGIAGERTTTYEYDGQNRLRAIVDPMGGRTEYDYDAEGNQFRITSADGTITENTFDAEGRILTNTVGVNRAHGGIRTTNVYDARGNILSTAVQYADGSNAALVSSYQYDALDRIERVTDREGFYSTFEYDAFGNQTKVTIGQYDSNTDDPDNAAKLARTSPRVTEFRYDAADQLLESIDGNGNKVSATYDKHGNRITQTVGQTTSDSTDQAHVSTTEFDYDLDGKLVEKRTAEGGQVVIVRDALGRQEQISTLQSSGVWVVETLGYDSHGRVISETDSYGAETISTYDPLGNLESIERPDGAITSYTYDLNSNLKTETDATGATTTYLYDAVGNQTGIIDAKGNSTYFYYNDFNQLVGVVDAEKFYTRYDVDVSGNVLTTTAYATALGSVPAGDVLPSPTADGANDRVTTQAYDKNGKRISETLANGLVREFEFDSTGLLLRQSENVGAVDAEWLSRTRDTASREISWEWDDAGRLLSYTGVDGVVESYTYDAAGNKLSETVHDPNALATTGALDPDRVTRYSYDFNNRLATQTNGDNVQTLGYDKAGNVVSKTDALGNVTETAYDLNNRVSSVTDALGQSISYGYDSAGNLTTVTDGRGYTTTYTYDLAGRVLTEETPDFATYTIEGGEQYGSVITSNIYDALGNLVERIDESGERNTSWYDGNGNVIAEVNVDGRFQEFGYNAFGELESIVTYKDRLDKPVGSWNFAVVPSTTGASTEIRNEYDRMGNITRTVYPEVEVTTVTGSGAAASASAQMEVLDEQTYYDAWGNLVESVDPRGTHSYSFYDSLGRQIALVDGEGYLLETAYDAQGNLIQQRRYETALSGTEPQTLPDASAAGKVHVVDRYFDEQNRLVSQVSQEVGTEGGLSRVTTTYAYDAVGNQISRTLADGEAEEQTEYYYYDAIGQRRAIVSSNRVLNTLSYDENGNVESRKRYINTVAGSVDLTDTSFGALETGIARDAAQDQESTYAYNRVNMLVSQTDVMQDGDIVTSFEYDAAGNLTRKTDAEGNVNRVAYNAFGRVIQTITATGGHSFVEYNVAGQQIKSWTGGDPDSTAPLVAASSITSSVSSGPAGSLSIDWDIPSATATSWVAWSIGSSVAVGEGEAPSFGPDGAHGDGVYQFASDSTALGLSRNVEIPADEFSPGDTIVFRVMVKDAANNLSWSEERSLVVPATLSEVEVSRAGEDFLVEVEFDDAVSGPTISSGDLPADVTMTLVSGNRYSAILSGVADPTTAVFSFNWSYNSASYTAPAGTLLRASEAEVDDFSGSVIWTVPSDGANTAGESQLLVVDGLLVTDSSLTSRVNGTFQYAPVSEAALNYDIFYGDESPQSHSIDIGFSDTQDIDWTKQSEEKDGDGKVVKTTWKKTWKSDGDGLIHTDVEAGLSTEEAARVNGDGLKLAYREAATDGNFADEVAMSASSGTYSATLDLTQNTSYDLKIYYVDSDGNEVIVDWRRIDVPAESSNENDGTVTRNGTSKPPGGSREVDVGTPISESDNYSLTVLASERDGQIGAGSAATRAVFEGSFSGPVDPATLALIIGLTDTGGAEGGRQADGFADGTYYTEIRYNDMGIKVASNEERGLWQTYGVDANGNTVYTRLYGVEGNTAFVETFAYFDKRNYETVSIGPEVNGAAPVTETDYDYRGQVTQIRKPGGTAAGTVSSSYSYDGVGNLLVYTDELGGTTTQAFDRLGNLVWLEDQVGHVQRLYYNYSGEQAGFLRETSFEGLTNATESYTYDVFGRRTALVRGYQSVSVEYDQHNRAAKVSTVIDGDEHVTTYYYDKLDRQVWLQDAEGNFFGRDYNEAGQVTDEYSFTSAPGDLAEAQSLAEDSKAARLADDVGSRPETIIHEQTTYDVFNNRMTSSDAEWRSQSFTYGAFGRLETAYGLSYSYDDFGQQVAETDGDEHDISRGYNAAGQLIWIDDAGTGARTDYSYDLAGNRETEVLEIDGTLRRSQTYSYNGKGELTRWEDTYPSTDIATDYAYFADGNIESIADSGGTTTTYTHDAANRVLTVNRAGTTETFSYDSAGNRASSVVGTDSFTYAYDEAGRLTTATLNGSEKYTWQYDRVGNVTRVSSGSEWTTTTYDDSYRAYVSENKSSDSHTVTTTTFDLSGRVTKTKLEDKTDSDEVLKFTYKYEYTDAGLQKSITATGDAKGSSKSTYDSNGLLIKVNLGKGDDEDQESDEINTFLRDNDGRIIAATRDSGMKDESAETTHYLYALGYAVGEYTDPANPTINEGNYATVKSYNPGLGENSITFPETAVLWHTVEAGDTLQTLAARYYGSPDLWFVIAEANGLTGTEPLQPGSALLIPTTAQNAYHTAETHTLYKEGDIVGSTLPNLKSPPPDDGETCKIVGLIIAIVIVAIIAVVATIVTVGVLAPAAIAAIGITTGTIGGTIAAISVGVAVGAVVGAAIAFAASVLTQVILVAGGLQEEWDWNAVLADVVTGAIGGAAAGLGAAVSVAKVATTTLKVVNVVGQIALESAGEVASQTIQNDGKITNPWLIVLAGAGGALGSIADIGKRASKTANTLADVDVDGIANKTAKVTAAVKDAKDARKAFNAVNNAATRSKKFSTAAKQGLDGVLSGPGQDLKSLKKTFASVKNFAKKAVTRVKEFRATGKTVAGSKDAQGYTKKIVSGFETVNGVRQPVEKTVIRNSQKTILKNFRGLGRDYVRYLDDAGDVKAKFVASTSPLARVKSAFNKVKQLPGKAIDAVKEFRDIRKAGSRLVTDGSDPNSLKKIIKVSDGAGGLVDKVVIRNSKRKVVDPVNDALKKVRSLDDTGNVVEKTLVRQSRLGTSKTAKALKYVSTYGSLGVSFAEEIVRDQTDNQRQDDGESLVRGNRVSVEGALRGLAVFAPAVGTFKIPLIYELQKPFGLEIVGEPDPVIDDYITKPFAEPEPISDYNARSTFADQHARQHSWISLNWSDVAASTTSQVLSPFELDYSADTDAVLSSHRMVSGQVSQFSEAAIVAFAERSVGGVGGDVFRTPSLAG